MYFLNLKKPSHNIKEIFNKGWCILFEGVPPETIPTELKYLDDFGSINLGEIAALYKIASLNEMDQFDYFGKPKDYINHEEVSMGLGSAQYLKRDRLAGAIKVSSSIDRWILTPNKSRSFYPYGDYREGLSSLMSFVGTSSFSLTDSSQEESRYAYFEFTKRVQIDEIHWSTSTVNLFRSYYPKIEVWNEELNLWSKYEGTSGSTGTYESSMSIYDSDLMLNNSSNYAKDLSENPLIGQKFRVSSSNSSDRYMDSSWSFVSRVDPVTSGLRTVNNPTWGIQVSEENKVLTLFNVTVGEDSSGTFHIGESLKNCQKLRLAQYKFYIPSMSSNLEELLFEQGVTHFDDPNSTGWIRLGEMGKNPNVSNWIDILQSMKFGIKVVDDLTNQVMGWVHKEELIRGNGLLITEVESLYPGNYEGLESDPYSVYLYHNVDTDGNVRYLSFAGPQKGLKIPVSPSGNSRTFIRGLTFKEGWSIYIDGSTEVIPYHENSLLGPSELTFSANSLWSSSTWTNEDLSDGRLSNGDKINNSGTNAIRFGSIGSFLSFELPSSSGITLTPLAEDSPLFVVRVSDGMEHKLNLSSGVDRKFNLPGGSYKLVGTNKTTVTEFLSVKQHIGYLDLEFFEKPPGIVFREFEVTWGDPTSGYLTNHDIQTYSTTEAINLNGSDDFITFELLEDATIITASHTHIADIVLENKSSGLTASLVYSNKKELMFRLSKGIYVLRGTSSTVLTEFRTDQVKESLPFPAWS
jgi:hypothetical protein